MKSALFKELHMSLFESVKFCMRSVSKRQQAIIYDEEISERPGRAHQEQRRCLLTRLHPVQGPAMRLQMQGGPGQLGTWFCSSCRVKKKSCILVTSEFCFLSLVTEINCFLISFYPKKEFDHISFQFLTTLKYCPMVKM